MKHFFMFCAGADDPDESTPEENPESIEPQPGTSGMSSASGSQLENPKETENVLLSGEAVLSRREEREA